MKERTLCCIRNRAVWKALFVFIAVLFLSAAVCTAAYADNKKEQAEIVSAEYTASEIIAKQIAFPIEGVSCSLYDVISLTVYKTDGSIDEVQSGFHTSVDGKAGNENFSEWHAGDHDVTVSYSGCSTSLTVEMIENPYTAIRFSEDRPLEVELTKKDKTKGVLHLGMVYNGNTICTDNKMINLIYDSDRDVILLGDVECEQSVSEIQWLKTLILSSPRFHPAFLFSWKEYDRETGRATLDHSLSYAGVVTPENLDRLVLISFFAASGGEREFNRVPPEPVFYSSWAYSVPLERMQQMIFNTFGLKNVDLSSSKRYDTKREIMFGIEGYGVGGVKNTVSFEKGMLVYRMFVFADYEKQILEEQPFMTVTFNEAAQITGIYFSDLPGKTAGDVDGDAKVTSADARLALRASVELEQYAPFSAAFAAVDVNCNGDLEPADARLILRACVGLENLV